MTTERNSLHRPGAGISHTIQLFIFGYIQIIEQSDAITVRRPEFGPQRLRIVFGQRLETRFQPFRQFGLVIKTIGRALKGIPDVPTVVTQIPIAHPIMPKPNLRHIVRNRRHTCQIKQASSQNSQVYLVNGIAQILIGIFVDGGECIFENPIVRNRVGRNNGGFRHNRIRLLSHRCSKPTPSVVVFSSPLADYAQTDGKTLRKIRLNRPG